MKKNIPLRKKNILGMNKEDADAVMSARWKCRVKILFPLTAYVLLFNLLAYCVLSVLGLGKDYTIPTVIVCAIQAFAIIKLAFHLCGDVLTPIEREHYNSLA